MFGFQNREILRCQMVVPGLAGKDREQKRQVGVVGIQQIEPAQILSVIAGNDREVGVELVVGLGE